MFGVTVRSKLGQLVLYSLSLFVLGVVLSLRWGYAAWAVPALMVACSVAAARQVASARTDVWRAAGAPIDERRPREQVELEARLVGPTAASLRRLAAAVEAVRRTRYAEADALVPQIERRLLRPEEVQLLEAVRAMVSVGLGKTEVGARQAVTALPTGSEDLDACLGRAVVMDAWNDPARLGAIQRAWDEAGVEAGPLSRLRTLVRIRLDAGHIEAVETPKARELSDEARAIGDDDLASELDARSRVAYRS